MKLGFEVRLQACETGLATTVPSVHVKAPYFRDRVHMNVLQTSRQRWSERYFLAALFRPRWTLTRL